MCDKCIICNHNLEDDDETPCGHWVATIMDDYDGSDGEFIYFGWVQLWTSHHCEMYNAFEEYGCAVVEIAKFCVKQGPSTAKAVTNAAKAFPKAEGACLKEVIEYVMQEENIKALTEDYEGDLKPLIVYSPFPKLFFKALYKNTGNASNVDPYEISSGPGLTWGGANYWAADACACVNAIISQCSEAADRILELYKRLTDTRERS